MFKELNNKVYYVGGCVRDGIMNIIPHDIDYVIEKTSTEEYESIFPEHKKVGVSFPVYIHSELNSEIALARVERATSECGNYHDFEVKTNVSIESDLSRRDFSINSIAKNYLTHEYVDPFNGIHDIKNKILRCVNPKAFIEDAIRIYRGARFIARFNLTVEKETLKLIKEHKHILKAVNNERVYIELKKTYNEAKTPSLFFDFLKDINAIDYHFDILEPKIYKSNLDAFNKAKENFYSFDVALAALFHNIDDKKLRTFINKHKFTAKQNELIINFNLIKKDFDNLETLSIIEVVQFFMKIKKNLFQYIEIYDATNTIDSSKSTILFKMKDVFEKTQICVPKEIQSKGKKSIIDYVEHEYVKAYNTL